MIPWSLLEGLSSRRSAVGFHAGFGRGDFELLWGDQRLRPRVDDTMLALQDGRQLLHLRFERLAGEHIDARAAAFARPAVEDHGSITRFIFERNSRRSVQDHTE